MSTHVTVREVLGHPITPFVARCSACDMTFIASRRHRAHAGRGVSLHRVRRRSRGAAARRGGVVMIRHTTTITLEDDEGLEIKLELPARKVVCPDCRGLGRTLVDGLRSHAFSREEFDETFDDDEDRAAYFDHRSHYHETCNTCGGANVIDEVDTAALSPAQRKQYRAHLRIRRELDEVDHMQEMERRMGA